MVSGISGLCPKKICLRFLSPKNNRPSVPASVLPPHSTFPSSSPGMTYPFHLQLTHHDQNQPSIRETNRYLNSRQRGLLRDFMESTLRGKAPVPQAKKWTGWAVWCSRLSHHWDAHIPYGGVSTPLPDTASWEAVDYSWSSGFLPPTWSPALSLAKLWLL